LLTTLYASPFNLILNDSIYSKIIATNYYGNSPYSTEGNGGITVFVPNAPINLANDPAVTSDTIIRFNWT
jgi:hypothetical protein